MATLVSPGVQVTVTDQSNYAPGVAGSSAYVLLATAENKVAPGGTSFAAGTLAENAGSVYNVTSQRDLVTLFGNPLFATSASGAPLHGDERNEAGLLAAYSALGVSNNMYVQRADVDLSQLTGSATAPAGTPTNGTHWLDLSETKWGIFVWNSSTQTYTEITPVLVADSSFSKSDDPVGLPVYPDSSVGSIGSYAVVTTTNHNHVFRKMYDNTWQLVGSTEWQDRTPTITSTVAAAGAIITADATISINEINVSLSLGDTMTDIANAINLTGIDGITARVTGSNQLIISANYSANSGLVIDTGVVSIQDQIGSALSEIGFTAGIYYAARIVQSEYYTVPTFDSSYATGSIWYKTSTLGNGLNIIVKKYSAVSNAWQSIPAIAEVSLSAATRFYDPTTGGLNVPAGSLFVNVNPEAFLNVVPNLGSMLWYRKYTGATESVGSTTSPSNPGLNTEFTVSFIDADDVFIQLTVTVTTDSPSGFVSAFNQTMGNNNIDFIRALLLPSGAVSIIHELGGDILLESTVGTPLENVGIDPNGTRMEQSSQLSNGVTITNWDRLGNLGYYASVTAPYSAPVTDTLWYNNVPGRIDIMINNGTSWVGYRTLAADIRGYDLTLTNAAGPMFASVAPETQDDGSPLVYGDLWVDSSNLEDYPSLHRWQRVSGVDQWVVIDHHDTVGSNGIVFGDARWATNGDTDPALDDAPSIADLALSSYVDLDAIDPGLHPRGMLLFNTRASGYNVKQYKAHYFTEAAYPNQTLPTVAATWVSVAGYQQNTIPNFGRKAQRGVVIAALKAAIDSNTVLREDATQFNLMACPGYPELMPNMVALNNDRNNTAFIIGDTPLRLPASGTAIQNWATNADGFGLSTVNPYVGVYYPNGLANDLSGNSVAVPSSHAVLRSMLVSDNSSYPWIAPAGTRRGIIDNLSAIGYVDRQTGAFVNVGVTQGLRDVMYTNSVNPLTNLPGAGLVIYGQKTLAQSPSALDRINVARLVNYIRSQLDATSRPFLFEPNDSITRKHLSTVVNGLMNDLVAKRGVADYVVVCDSSNNTPDRINRNELWVDVAVQPTKDVEFIYIPIRLVAAGQLDGVPVTAGTGA